MCLYDGVGRTGAGRTQVALGIKEGFNHLLDQRGGEECFEGPD